MRSVYSTYDTNFNTWNVMDIEKQECIFYGTAEELEDFLNTHKNEFREIPTINFLH